MKYCPYCGKLLLGDDDACPKCGKIIASHAYDGYYTVAEPNEFYTTVKAKSKRKSLLALIFSSLAFFFSLKGIENPFRIVPTISSLAFFVVSLVMGKRFLKAGYHKNTFIFLSRVFNICALGLNIIGKAAGLFIGVIILIAIAISLLIILL